ncbi:hypothetical protein JCM19992_00310 [Thermostilla marina]
MSDSSADIFDFDTHNLREIERLNQRGGRMLSIVDLLNAGTIGLEMTACAFEAIESGASLLTAARPGGAGKTTIMAALLGLLPPGIPIVTVADEAIIDRAQRDPLPIPPCFLVHEIGNGPYFGYLWGPKTRDYFQLTRRGARIASCLHADTLPELESILTGPPLEVAAEDLHRLGLILFVHVARQGSAVVRRVDTLYRTDNGRLELMFRRRSEEIAPQGASWEEMDGALFECLADDETRRRWAPHREFLAALAERCASPDLETVRRAVVGWYRDRTA